MDRIHNITIQGRFLPQCQGCTKLALERNSYDNIWNCCYYYSCAYTLSHSGRCTGTDNHEEPFEVPREEQPVGHA